MSPGFAKFFELCCDGLILGGVYALVAVGYSLVYGIIKLINFAHGEVAMFGAFFAFITVGYMSGPETPTDTDFASALLVAVLLTVLLGLFLEWVAYRPLRKATRLSALITTIGMSLILQNLAVFFFGAEDHLMPVPDAFYGAAMTIGADGGPDSIPVDITWKLVIVTIVVLVSMLALWWTVERTKMGKAMRACSMDGDAAALMGIDINRVVAFTFVLGSAMAAISGYLLVQHVPIVRYDIGIQVGIVAFAAAVLGGIGSIPGALLGGFLIGFSQAMADGYLGDFGEWIGHSSLSGAYKESVAFLIMIVILLFKPSGLLGREEADRA